MTTDAWVEKRKGKISASNVSAILGLRPFGRTPIDAWQQIMGYAPVTVPTKAQKMGQRAEALIAEIYAEDEGVKLLTPQEPIPHPALPWLCGTPDRLIIGQPKGVEIKNVGEHMLYDWGKPGSDEIPDYYLTQVAIYMAITGYDEFDVVASLAGAYPEVFTVTRDRELENDILKKLDEWYVVHIAGNMPPEPDETMNYAEYLKRRWPRNEKPLKKADAVIESAMANLAEARKDYDQAEERKILYENIIKSYIGDAEGVSGETGEITWKAAKDTRKVDWEKAFKAVVSIEEVREALDVCEIDAQKVAIAFAATVPGSRRFLTKFNKLY